MHARPRSSRGEPYRSCLDDRLRHRPARPVTSPLPSRALARLRRRSRVLCRDLDRQPQLPRTIALPCAGAACRSTLHAQLPIASAAGLGPALGDKRASELVALDDRIRVQDPLRSGRVLCRERDRETQRLTLASAPPRRLLTLRASARRSVAFPGDERMGQRVASGRGEHILKLS
jgi:hypothetical protein